MSERASYGSYVYGATLQTLSLMPRRKLTYLAAFVIFAPVVMPIALVVTSDIWYDAEGGATFTRMADFIYVNLLSSLTALFFACMLIGEDIESQTFPYILTRPVPRSAWVLGKFIGYLLGTSFLLLSSLAVTYLACTRLANFPVSGESLRLFGRFAGITCLALGAYGAVCMFLGALAKRPIIWGVILFFVWQRIALFLPGYSGFVTVQKYLVALVPARSGRPAGERVVTELQDVEVLGTSVGEAFPGIIERFYITVEPVPAAITLVGIAVGFALLTSYVVRTREYTGASSTGG